MISQTAEYALRAAVHLAANPDSGPAAAKDIADAVQVPVGYLQKVLRMLCRYRSSLTEGIGEWTTAKERAKV